MMCQDFVVPKRCVGVPHFAAAAEGNGFLCSLEEDGSYKEDVSPRLDVLIPYTRSIVMNHMTP